MIEKLKLIELLFELFPDFYLYFRYVDLCRLYHVNKTMKKNMGLYIKKFCLVEHCNYSEIQPLLLYYIKK